MKYLRKGVEGDLLALVNDNNGIANLLRNDSNGFALPVAMNTQIAQAMYNNSPIRQLARIVNVSRDSLDVASYTTDIVAQWGDERSVAPETDAFMLTSALGTTRPSESTIMTDA